MVGNRVYLWAQSYAGFGGFPDCSHHAFHHRKTDTGDHNDYCPFQYLLESRAWGSHAMAVRHGRIFGLIHGLGFSNYLKALLGSEEDLILPLFAFNLGVEGGQILIVAVAMLLNLVWTGVLKLPNYFWIRLVSVVSFWVAFYLLFKQF